MKDEEGKKPLRNRTRARGSNEAIRCHVVFVKVTLTAGQVDKGGLDSYTEDSSVVYCRNQNFTCPLL